jgi:hypothetical protein
MSETVPPLRLDLSPLGYRFEDKPILVGGGAMQHYGLRERGDDLDFIVSARDYAALEAGHRDCRKDIWGDFGLRIGEYELFRSMYKFDHPYFDAGSSDLGDYKVVSIDMLFRMQVFAMGSGEKRRRDVELLKGYFMRSQNREYLAFMDRNVPRYLAAPDGLVLNGDYY